MEGITGATRAAALSCQPLAGVRSADQLSVF